MIKPTIHMNGSSRAYLLDVYQEAAIALRQAIEALRAAGPNGRDYYPQGPAAIGVAQQEHRDRLMAVERVCAEIGELYEYVAG